MLLSCPDARISLERIRSLKQQFDSAFDQALSSGDRTYIQQAHEHKRAFIESAHALQESLMIHKIISREQEANRKFFGKDYPIDPFPKEATLERITEWRELGLELHYLPSVSMVKIETDPTTGEILTATPINLPGWHEKPGAWLFDQVKNDNGSVAQP